METGDSEIKLEDYSSEYNPNPFRHIIGTHLAPNQSIVCNLNTDKLNADKVEQLPFQIKYFGNKDYVENIVVNFTAETENVIVRAHKQKSEEEIKIISSTLQGIYEEML